MQKTRNVAANGMKAMTDTNEIFAFLRDIRIVRAICIQCKDVILVKKKQLNLTDG
jgi:hypothetical protein